MGPGVVERVCKEKEKREKGVDEKEVLQIPPPLCVEGIKSLFSPPVTESQVAADVIIHWPTTYVICTLVRLAGTAQVRKPCSEEDKRV